MVITSRAPVRIDFAGAWTDVSYFADTFGGATLNAAIDLHVSGSLAASDDEDSGILRSQDVSSVEPALAVSYGSVIPAGSGLGTSGTLNVVWLALARREPIESDDDRMRIAELAYDIEKTLGIIGGKQDQYASAVGGINLFEFTDTGVSRRPVNISRERAAELASMLLLVYTGKTRLSSNIHRNVWGAFREGREDTIRALFDLRTSAYEATTALEAWDLEAFSRVVTSQRRHMRRLDDSTTNAHMEEIFSLAEADTLGGKPCGAGGGGCAFFIARSANAKESLREKLAGVGLSGVDVHFDFDGLVLSTS